MPILHVLDSQTREVEASITEAGLNVDDFKFTSVKSPTFKGAALVHAGSVRRENYYFNFDNHGGKFVSQWSPAKETVTDEKGFSNWKEQLGQFQTWLLFLKRELGHSEGLGSELLSSTEIVNNDGSIGTDSLEPDSEPHQLDLKSALIGLTSPQADWVVKAVESAKAKPALQELAGLIGLLRGLVTLDLDYLPPVKMQKLESWTSRATRLSTEFANNPSPEKLEVLERSASILFKESYDDLCLIASYTRVKDFGDDGIRKEIKTILSEMKQAKVEMDELIKRLKEDSQKVTIAKEAKYFANEAAAHDKFSWIWLSITVALAALTFVLSKGSYDLIVKNIEEGKDLLSLTTYQSAQLVVSKVILYSLLVGSVFWLGRVYKAHRHNYVVNRHRANALNCFNVFVASTTDEQMKNAVLMHAAQCIFTPQMSGYVSQESDGSGIPQIVEVVKDISKQSK
jgi:hypothetical protein